MNTSVNGQSGNNVPSNLHLTPGSDKQSNLLNRSLDTPVKDTKETQTRRKHWESAHIPSLNINGSGNRTLSSREVSLGLNTYSNEQLPWPDQHHTYFKDEQGSLMLMKNEHCQGGISMTMYAANPNTSPQYTTQKILKTSSEPLHHLEAFATANKKNISQKLRDTYPIHTYPPCRDIPQDRGHGIDFILTMPENTHSSIDSSNYTPQNAIYNRSVRMLLVKALVNQGNTSFKEINVYGPTPDQLIQKEGRKYSISKKVETHSIDVPEGFLFIVYDPLKKIKSVYFFPNFIDYEKLKKTQGIDYSKVPALFEIEIKEENIDYTKISPFFDIESLARSLWSKINLFGTDVYESKKSDDTISKEVRRKSYVGFRMLSGRYPVIFKQKDAADKWIPIAARQALERTLALKALNEMAENEVSSVEFKLALTRTLLSKMVYHELGQTLYHPASALLWLKRVEEQVANESTIEEKLELHDLYELLKTENPEIYADSNNNISAKKKELLIKIVRQENEEGSSIGVKFQLITKFNEEKNKLYFLQKTEEHIMRDLNNSNIDERTIAIEELHNLADYYSQFLGQSRYDIPLNYQKAHELYQIFFENFSSYFHIRDRHLYADHLKIMLMESPESIQVDHMITYAKFFQKIGYDEAASFWKRYTDEYRHKKQSIKN